MKEHLIPEVLSPAGDMERLDAALTFGADAVYLAGEKFGMRAASANFTRDEMVEAIKKTHKLGKKLYVTCNILPRNKDLDELPEYFAFLDSIGVDALIISDFGVMDIAKKYEYAVKLFSIKFIGGRRSTQRDGTGRQSL